MYPNTASYVLWLVGCIGHYGATLLSNGAGVVASLNALRPLLAAEPSTDRDLDQRGDEGLESELRRRPKHDGAQSRADGSARPDIPGRVPEITPGTHDFHDLL